MEFVMQIVIGLVLIVLGVSNRKGNISSLHSYHIKRIKEEDVKRTLKVRPTLGGSLLL